jgi:RNA polymerase sigma-70 factor (ECF subfamily)
MSHNVAFEILYREYYVRVFGLCRRLLNSQLLAEDATQEVFMRAFKQFKKFDSEQPFWRWIAAIATNHCIDLLRRQSRSANLFGDEQHESQLVAEPGSEILAAVISKEDSANLIQAVEQLPAKYRVPLILAYFHDASYEEIAAMLNLERNHVGVLILRAKQMLRTNMQDYQMQESM